MITYSTQSHDTELAELLSKVKKGELQLPEFQRDWTWDDDRIRAIIASLSQGYPMGAIMQLQYGNPEIRFKFRPLEGLSLGDIQPNCLILDGQQRLTSIYLATSCSNPVNTKTAQNKAIKRYYYLSLKDCLDESFDRFDAIHSLPEDKKLKENFDRDIVLDLSTREQEFKEHMFPVNIIFDSDASDKWEDDYKEFYNYDRTIIAQFNNFRNHVLGTIKKYKLPVITLSQSTPRDAVCKVFENVNTGGVVLTVFELVTATFAAQEFNLRQDWEQCKKVIRGDCLVRSENTGTGFPKLIFEDIEASLRTDLFNGIDATTYLTALTLYTSYQNKLAGITGAVSCKKKDVLNLTYEDYRNNQYAILQGFKLARNFLVQYQYIFRKRDLPYTTQIIPLVAICACLTSLSSDVIAKLSKWYWCGILGEMYGSANETKYANDIDDMMNSINGLESQNHTISAAFFSSTRLLTLQTRNSAAYKGIMGLLYKAQCTDFMKDLTINAANCMIDVPDIHHIFPEAYCKQIGIKIEKYNSIVNKTPLLAETNRAIGGKAPQIYLASILKKVENIDQAILKRRIESHFINYEYLESNDFDLYFVDRAKKILDLIENAMDKQVTDRGAQNTIESFGTNLINDVV